MTAPSPRFYRFGPFRLDTDDRSLLRDGQPIPLTPKAYETLLALVERPGQIVEKAVLRRLVWPDAVVEENNLNQAVSAVRKALADQGSALIETVPRRGYRFLGDVTAVSGDAGVLVAEPRRNTVMVEGEEAIESVESPAQPARPAGRSGKALIAVVAVALTGLAGSLAYQRLGRPSARVMLVVLPFENLSGDAGQEYLSDGMTEETIAQIGRLSPEHLGVIARTSAMRYKGTRKGIDEIGRELKVDYVLEGSVRRQGDRVRITGQLIRVRDQANLWAQSYDRDARDMLELQADIARGAAREISRALTSAGGTGRGAAVHPDAYQAYLKGRYFRNKAQYWANQTAIGHFEQAIRTDPAFTLAYVGLAESAVFSYPSRETMPKAKDAALKAIALDPSLAEAHAALGLVQTYWEWDWPGAARSFQRALELNPGNHEIHHYYSQYLSAVGRFDEAIHEAERALELDPLSPLISQQVGRAFYFARRFDEAIAQYRKTLDLEANDFWALFFMGLAYEQKGSYAEAIDFIKRSREVVGDSELARLLPAAYAASGYEGALREWVQHWDAQAKQGRSVQWLSVAALYSRLGDIEKAWECLSKAHDERTRAFVYVKVEPQLDNLRKDPRFQELLRGMKFPGE